MQNNILTITQLNYSVKQLLESQLGYVWLVGEISNFSQPISGHWYLTLKDEQSQVRCAMFRMKNQRVNFKPQNGMQVLVRANVSLYEPRGDYQVIIESMQPAGDGLLQQQFEQLKMKLAGEGLFSHDHKKPIPPHIKTVGVVTSQSGAALQDILNILKRRDPSLQVIIYPTLVQGKDAAQDITQMINLANLRKECDVLIVGRGGGSLEDLWCFNEEIVARAIYESTLPIISAVGHETDVTIADFVADLRAPTPSAAAELVSRDRQELVRQLQNQFDRVNLAFDRLWSVKTKHFTYLKTRLAAQHPQRHLSRQKQQIEALNQRIIQQMQQVFVRKENQWKMMQHRVNKNPLPHKISQKQYDIVKLQQKLNYLMDKKLVHNQREFQQLCIQLESLSPLKVFSRGYSMTQDQSGKALVSTQGLKVDDVISTRLADGQITSKILSVEN
ncbi:exodeoxyribonuclease VII large subunit [Otariodibacter oris]|uniref:Exodeoxyribonuclease 7 large subunit n=1 Tax=Otariodibacter oris TaxID=1032623 RepID=A0A420XIK2_9PAST|nr:exodeoxyribonuclease VII large subunit [Otariodibacter oris]QGM80856.1 exodeoxyribonuclease VII large subunit [Otariodibacter oris]RKR76971.1 exodeoxyribonuclease VII large subunit [Otariodibacter oris]